MLVSAHSVFVPTTEERTETPPPAEIEEEQNVRTSTAAARTADQRYLNTNLYLLIN